MPIGLVVAIVVFVSVIAYVIGECFGHDAGFKKGRRWRELDELYCIRKHWPD